MYAIYSCCLKRQIRRKKLIDNWNDTRRCGLRRNFSFDSSIHRVQLQRIMTLIATMYARAFSESKGAGNESSFAAVYLYPPICHARVSIAIAQCRPLFAARIKLDSQAFAVTRVYVYYTVAIRHPPAWPLDYQITVTYLHTS